MKGKVNYNDYILSTRDCQMCKCIVKRPYLCDLTFLSECELKARFFVHVRDFSCLSLNIKHNSSCMLEVCCS